VEPNSCRGRRSVSSTAAPMLSELALELSGLMAGGYAVAPSALIRRRRWMGFAWPGSP
jgi:hypothetical protein